MYGQKHDYTWVYGYLNNPDTSSKVGGAIVDFKQRPPLHYKENRELNFDLFCAACSDSTGNLLFYSNGNQLIENGDTINPGSIWQSNQNFGYPSVYGGFALPAPGKQNCYYFFHLPFYFDNGQIIESPLYYSFIDMNANNGEGKVMAKNQVLLQADLTHPRAVKHANGRDWWVLTAQGSEPLYYLFLISPEGVQGPMTQILGDPFPNVEARGISTFSPDGTFFARCDANNGLYLMDFNRCTGARMIKFIILLPEPHLASMSLTGLTCPAWLAMLKIMECNYLESMDAPPVFSRTIAWVNGRGRPVIQSTANDPTMALSKHLTKLSWSGRQRHRHISYLPTLLDNQSRYH